MKKETGIKRTLDDIFSKFIRIRDSDVFGYITCVSCKIKVKWEDANCCHYANRQHMATRWDEVNNHAGCYYCNCFNKGFHLHEYGKYLDENYGPGTAEGLMIKSQTVAHISTEDMKDLIKTYKLKIKEYGKN